MRTILAPLPLLLLIPSIAVAQEESGGDAGDAAPATASVDDVQPGSDADLEVFRQTYARYTERMEEIRAEIKRVVTHRYEEELRRIRSSYDAQTAEKEAEEREQRLRAIREHEEFIAKYPDSPYTAHRMFRLSSLYLEETDYQLLVDLEDYRKLEQQFDRGEIETLPEPPGKNYARSVRLFKRLIKDFPDYKYLDAAYYLLGYCYWDELSEQQDDELALATYHELTEVLPDSRYAANGHFMLGEVYFDDLEFDKAIAEYSAVMESGREDLWDRSLYKLAWAYYRKDDLDAAIPKFVELIDHSDTMLKEEGKESQLKPESLKYLAISLTDQADDQMVNPVTRAEEFFNEIGDRAYKYDVLVGINEVLKQQGRYDEEIVVLERIMELYPYSPDNPDFQYLVMTLHYAKDNPDPDAAIAARIALVERYKEGTPWWEANKANPDALRAASRYIEESLGDVARTYHAHAQSLFTEIGQQPASTEYLKAAAAYQDYLDRFPFAKDAYETQFQIAECYYYAGDFETAVAEYLKLERYPDTQYRGDTLDALAFAYEQLMNRQDGDYKANPQALANMQIALGEAPEQIQVIPLSDSQTRFVETADALYEFNPAHKDIARKLYIAAEIYYYHNQIDEARRRFQMIIDTYPTLAFAAYAVGHMVDSYHKTGDVQKVYELAEHYRNVEMLGEDEDLWTERREFFEVKKRNAQFILAEKAAASGEPEDLKRSGELYYAFYKEYPDNENAALALFNSALRYENAGDTVTANRYYEEFLDEYSKDERAPSIFFRIAGQYERTMDLDRAIDYYVRVARDHPNYKDPETGENYTANAWFNAAFLSLGIKEYDQAARYFLKYAGFPDAKDPHDAVWRAAEAYRDGGNQSKALATYQEYNRKYGDVDINRTMESLIKQATIYADMGRSRDEQKKKDELLELYHRARAEGAELNSVSVAAAAEAAFPAIEEMLAEYAEIRYPDTLDPEKLKPVHEEKIAKAREIQEAASQFLATYPDFNYIMACMYVRANVMQDFADMVWAWDPPYSRKIMGVPKNEDTEIEWMDLVDEQKIAIAEPLESEAIQLFETVLAKAKEMKKNAPYVEKAREALNKVDPNTYPMLKPQKTEFGDAPYETTPRPASAPVEESS